MRTIAYALLPLCLSVACDQSGSGSSHALTSQGEADATSDNDVPSVEFDQQDTTVPATVVPAVVAPNAGSSPAPVAPANAVEPTAAAAPQQEETVVSATSLPLDVAVSVNEGDTQEAVTLPLVTDETPGASTTQPDAATTQEVPASAISDSWVVQFGSMANDFAKDVRIDSAGNAYVVGKLGAESSGGPGPVLVGHLAYLHKYDAAGTLLWKRDLGAPPRESGTGLAVDQNGNIVLGGETTRALEGQTSAGGTDVFVRKYDPNGAALWTRQFGSSAEEALSGVATDAAGSVVAVGRTAGALSTQPSAGKTDTFVRKYDAAGTELWTKQLGTSGNDGANAVATDAQGNVYVAGYLEEVRPLRNQGTTDAVLYKLDPAGNMLWTRSYVTIDNDWGQAVATDGQGNAYLGGYSKLGGSEAAFLIKYDPAGSATWRNYLGLAGNYTRVKALSTDASGSLYVAGSATAALSGETLAGGFDALVRKYDASGNVAWTRFVGTSAREEANGIAVDATGHVWLAGLTSGAFPGYSNRAVSSDYPEDAFLARLAP